MPNGLTYDIKNNSQIYIQSGTLQGTFNVSGDGYLEGGTAKNFGVFRGSLAATSVVNVVGDAWLKNFNGGYTVNLSENQTLSTQAGTFNGTLAGTGNLTVTGGTLTVNNAASGTYTGKTTIENGTLAVNWNGFKTTNFELNYGTLDISSSSNFYTDQGATITVGAIGTTTSRVYDSRATTNGWNLNGGTLSLSAQAGSALDIQSRVYNDDTNHGNVIVTGGTVKMTSTNGGDYTGKTTINNGTLAVSWQNFRTSDFELNNGTLDISTSGNFYTSLASVTISAVGTGTSTIYDSRAAGNEGMINLNGTTYNFSAAKDTTLSVEALIRNNGTMNISGEGTVNFGYLNPAKKAESVTINSTTSKLNAAGAPLGAMTITSGILSAGKVDNGIGSLEVTTLATVNYAKLLFDFGTLPTDGHDSLILDTTDGLTLSDNTRFDLFFNGDMLDWWVKDASYELITFTNTNEQYLGDLNRFLSSGASTYWNLVGTSTGISLEAAFVSVPEPSTWALLILGAAGLLLFRRKK